MLADVAQAVENDRARVEARRAALLNPVDGSGDELLRDDQIYRSLLALPYEKQLDVIGSNARVRLALARHPAPEAVPVASRARDLYREERTQACAAELAAIESDRDAVEGWAGSTVRALDELLK